MQTKNTETGKPTSRQQRGGFTLMELMLVLVILGVIAGIAGPMLMNMRDQANVDAAKTAVGSIEKIVENFYSQHTALPTSLKDLYERPTSNINNSANWVQTIDKSKLVDPWGNEYKYEATAHNGKRFKIWSEGPDPSNQSDNIGNWPIEQQQ